jgi:hypothetical protein
MLERTKLDNVPSARVDFSDSARGWQAPEVDGLRVASSPANGGKWEGCHRATPPASRGSATWRLGETVVVRLQPRDLALLGAWMVEQDDIQEKPTVGDPPPDHLVFGEGKEPLHRR